MGWVGRRGGWRFELAGRWVGVGCWGGGVCFVEALEFERVAVHKYSE